MDIELARLIQNPGWGLSLSKSALIIDAPSKTEARALIDAVADALAITASKLARQAALIRYPGCPRPYRLPALQAMDDNSMTSNNPSQAIQFPGILLSRELLSTVIRWAENPKIKGGIIALPSERQLIVTQECGSPIYCSWGIQTAVQKARPDFWHLPDLEAMRQHTQQESEFEFTWHSRLQRSDGRFARFTNRYRNVTDQFGNSFQISENLGLDLVPGLPLLV